MKQKDVASLLLITAIGFTVAFFLGKAILGSPEERRVEVEIVNSFDGEFADADRRIFNSKAINPTQEITINQADTDEPFVQ